MRQLCVLIIATFLCMTANLRAAAELLAPDLIIYNARAHTMDASHPVVEAVAVLGKRIVAIGSSAEIRALANSKTQQIDAQGKLLVPGFNDAHVHFLSGGFQLSNVDLRDAQTPEELARRLGAFAAKLPKGTWIEGGDWDHESWPGAPLPTREMIDAMTRDHPVFVSRLDGHMALANSVALRLAGITKGVHSPEGGLIVTNRETGEPTGIFKDAAMSLISRQIPEANFQQKLAAAKAASEHAASLGVTSVQDMSAGLDVSVYQELLRRGELKTRIYAMNPLPAWKRLADAGLRAPFGNDMLRVGGLKAFSDGSLGSTTAWFFESYYDATDTKGLPAGEMFPEGVMRERVQAAAGAQLHVMIHAIGDHANNYILNLYEQVGARDRRFRIEHAQHLRADDIPRFSALGVIPSMQPYHCADDGRWAEKRIGHERAKTTYAFRSLLDSGAKLAFGSDWTVAPLNPLLGIHAAVTRQTLDGKNPGGWIPEQKITVHEAVYAYTMGSACAEFAEADKGSITPGKLADLVLLDRDIFQIPADEIKTATVITTVSDGKIVFSR